MVIDLLGYVMIYGNYDMFGNFGEVMDVNGVVMVMIYMV